MAITWGGWVGSGNKRMRLGIEYTSVPTPASNTTTAVTVKANVWVEADYSFYDTSNTFAWSGTLGSGSASKSINVGSGASIAIHSLSSSVALNASGPTAVTVAASLRGINYVGESLQASVTASASIPAKPAAPVAIPTSPASLNGTRVSDTTTSFTWPTGAGATSYRLEKYTYPTGTTYVSQGTTTGTSFSSTNNAANQKYSFRVFSLNSAGGSSNPPYETVYTTPTAPNNVAAARSGNNTEVTWSSRSPYNNSWQIRYSTNNGSTWSSPVTVNGNGTRSYTLTGTSAALTHLFEVRAYINGNTDDVGYNLTSGWARSNLVAITAPPNAPTPLSPVGAVVNAATTSITFKWKHNPVDTSAQTGAVLGYRKVIDGVVGSATEVTVSGSAQQATVNISLTGVEAVNWYVRTKGASGVYGANSAVVSFPVSAAPVAGVLEPADAGTLNSSRLTVRWTFSDTDGDELDSTLIALYKTDTTPVWSGRVEGSVLSYEIPVNLPEGSYVLVLSVTDTSGLESEPVTTNFTVTYLLPPAPSVSAEWQEDTSNVLVTVDNPMGAVPETVDPVHNRIIRSSDGGLTWEQVSEYVELDGTFIDHTAPLNTWVQYKAIAVSALPSEATGDPTSVETYSINAIINYGPGFAESLVFPCDLDLPSSLIEHSTAHILSERPFPVNVYDLDHPPSREISMSGVVTYTPVAVVERVMSTAAHQDIYWRDLHGRAFLARVSDVKITPYHGHPKVSCTISESSG